jgi:hypothetical protein
MIASTQAPPSGEAISIPPGAPGCLREASRAAAWGVGRRTCRKYIPHFPARTSALPKWRNSTPTCAAATSSGASPETMAWCRKPAQKEARSVSPDCVLYVSPMTAARAVREKVTVEVAGVGLLDGGCTGVVCGGHNCWQ